MIAGNGRPSLVLLMVLIPLLAWGTLKTWSLLEGSYAFVPVFLAVMAISAMIKFVIIGSANLYNYLLRSEAYAESHQKGSARWAEEEDLNRAGLYDTTGVFLGTDMEGEPLFFDGETHGLSLAPAGKGKTVCMAIPALCHIPESMVVTAYKPSQAVMTANLRFEKHKHDVFCVNPARQNEDILGKPARYNPMIILIDDWLEGRHQDLIADAQDMALQLYPEPPHQGENVYWRQGTRKIIVFVIVYLVIENDGTQAMLSAVLTLLRNVPRLKEVCYLAACSTVLHGELADMATEALTKLEAEDTRQIESFLEGAVQSLLAFSPSGWLAESTSACDFRFKDLKDKPATVYLIADPTKMKVFAPWLGLMGWAAITELTRCQNNRPVFFLLDECTNFKIEGLSEKLTGLREFGIRCWFIFQELEEYARIYGRESLETLLSQTEVKQIFGVSSQKTAELVSRMLGEYTVKSPNYSLGHEPDDPVRYSVNEQPRKLLTPDEVRRFADMIIFVKNLPPIIAKKLGYHEVKPWSDWVDINPLFGKPYKGKAKLKLRY